MKRLLKTLWLEDNGLLSFEWVLLTTLLVIGIVAGLSGARDAVISELGDVAGAAICLDQSWNVGSVTTAEGETLAGGFSFDDPTPSFNVSRPDSGPSQ